MTIKETMLEMFHDNVYISAMLRAPEETEEELRTAETYYAGHPTDPYADAEPVFPGLPKSDLTWEQRLAQELHSNLYKTARTAWCRSYSREQMVQLLNLLAIGGGGVMDASVRICEGGDLETLPLLADAWNVSNPDAAPIHMAGPAI